MLNATFENVNKLNALWKKIGDKNTDFNHNQENQENKLV